MYRIFESNSIANLVALVVKAADEGLLPTGGVSVSQSRMGEVTFYQAVSGAGAGALAHGKTHSRPKE